VRSSYYNIYAKLDDYAGYVVYNGVTGGVLRIDNNTHDLLINGNIERLKPLAKQQLYNKQIIISDQNSQIDILKDRYDSIKKATDTAIFIVSPTTHCNLDCPYCYEHELIQTKHRMTASTSKRVFRFICNVLKKDSKKFAVLKFYGGEPLLEPDICRQLAKDVARWCKKAGIRMVTWLQTNGTLITKEFASNIIPCLEVCEVTIDGCKERHNGIRTNDRSELTYDHIINGIHLLSKHSASIIIRINAHGGNEMQAALSDLEKHGVMKLPNIAFYDGQVSSGFIKGNFAASCPRHINTSEQLDAIKEIRNVIGSSSWLDKYQQYPIFRPNCGICGFSKPGTYCIDPLGDLYSCIFQQGCKPQNIGKILDDGTTEMYANYDEIIARSPFEHEQCIKCPIISQCWGGCFVKAHYQKGSFSASCCNQMPDSIPHMLLASVEEKLNEIVKV